MNLFVHRDGQQFGPFTETDLRAKLAAGEFSPADLIWWDGQPGWIPLSQSIYATPVETASVVLPPPTPAPLAAAAIPGSVATGEQRTSGMAIASLVSGIIGLLFFLLGIVAVVLGHLSRAEIKRNPGTLKGEGMALAGLILGYLEIAFTLLGIVGLVVLLALGHQVQGVFSTVTPRAQPIPNTTNSAPANP